MSSASSELRNHFSTIAATYPAPDELESTEAARSVAQFPDLQDSFRQAAQLLENQIASEFGSEFIVDYGFGQGTLAHIPYIAIFRSDITESTQRGLYIVYLFDPITESVYLTLNQGATEMRRFRQSSDISASTAEVLHKQAEYYRGMPESGGYNNVSERWELGSATLSSELRRADEYNAGTICYRVYEGDALDESDLLTDVFALIQIYDSFLDVIYDLFTVSFADRAGYTLSVPSDEMWEQWLEAGLAALPADETDAQPGSLTGGDLIIAGRTDNVSDFVMGIGVVTEPPESNEQTSIQSTAETLRIDLTNSELIGVEWESFYAAGAPVSVPHTQRKLFSQPAVQPLEEALANRIISGVGHRYAAIEEEPTTWLADHFLSDLQLSGVLEYTGVGESSVLSDGPEDEPEASGPYWEMVETKCDKATEFVASPSKERFRALVSQDHFWATRAFGSLDYYLNEMVFEAQEPDEIAAALRAAAKEGIKQDGGLSQVLELDGFGWPVATEILRALERDTFAILNSRAVDGLEALGYNPPDTQTTSIDQYEAFTDNVREAVNRFGIRETLTEEYGERIPKNATDLEIGDRAFTLHVSGELELTDLTPIDGPSPPVTDTWTQPADVFAEVESSPAVPSLYFPAETEGVPLLQQIDNALRSGKHLILTGPPGSGKTELAKAICEHYVGQEYALVTATDDWSTFDTIGGYRPQRNDQLEFRPGVFLQRFLNGDETPEPANEWLIIDELNRADIDKAFGSLFSALTGNNVILPFENEEGQIEVVGDPDSYGHKPITTQHYYIPDSWRLIATMNTDDKSSLYRMSYAFMRRFAYISIPTPSVDAIDGALIHEYMTADRWDIDFTELVEDQDTADELIENVAIIWQAIQRRRQIGPALVRDILEHLEQQLRSGDAVTYAHPVAIHVFPQLEGLSTDDIDGLLTEIKQRVDSFNRALTDQFARDYLGVDLQG